MKALKTAQNPSCFGNWTGAFADGAVLFPLMAALAVQTGMNGAVLLATAGLAYIAAGALFRVPMSVQPLKSVVVAALALGASGTEVGLSGLIVGLFCLAFSFCNADRLAGYVPKHLVHGLQIALGVMLMTKGVKDGLLLTDPAMKMLLICLTSVMLGVSWLTTRPVMGWAALAGMIFGVIAAYGGLPGTSLPPNAMRPISGHTILSLVLPQLALTLANSVVGTRDVAQKYFKENAHRVTARRLLQSIGIGNILAAAFGGLPFCHGAGGVTAHVKGGAASWHMNLIAGGSLVFLAGMSAVIGVSFVPAYPKVLIAALLFCTGWFHLGLAKPSWEKPELRWMLVLMAIVALVKQDMLWVLAAGIGCEMVRWINTRRKTTAFL
jgi:SulP family sulfate permease